MSNNETDQMGGWTFEPTFAPEGADVQPDGTFTGQEIPLEQLQGNQHNDQQALNGPQVTVGPPAPINNGLLENGDGQAAETPVEPAEHSYDPMLPLNSRDVCAFIINKMIGTGIFIQPPAVLLFTQSKVEALFLWVLGFLYTLVSTLLYLEFSRRLPHTGGELIYLDETLPTPRLFAYTVYTFYFVFMYNTATNSMQLANQVLISANIKTPSFQPDVRELRFIAIVALSFFCLMHYFSGHAGRTLNQIFALFKVILLVIVFFAGIVRASHHYTADWTQPSNPDRSSSATAFLLIVFSFTGWENATFVSGEIANYRILRNGFIWAVSIVGALYLLVNLVFLLAVPYSELIKKDAITQYVPLFFGGGVKARLTWSILISISASGSLLSVIYTCARVKQVIGMSNIIPWSKLWESTSPIPRPRQRAQGRPERPTPKGGLILHWLMSLVLISATSRMYNINEAIGFPGNLQAYASGWVGIFISIGFPFLFFERDIQSMKLKARQIPLPTVRKWSQEGVSFFLRSRAAKAFFTMVYLGFNIYIVVVPLIGPYRNANKDSLEVRGWVYIVIVGSIFTAAVIYYYMAFGYKQTFDANLNTVKPTRTIARWANACPLLCEEPIHDQQYGVRRKVEMVYEKTEPSYLYWMFGGSKKEHHPSSPFVHVWDRLMGR